MLEIALSFTAFLLLTVGVMEFAMAVYAFNFCSYASGEAARWASVRGAQYSSSATPPLPALTQQDVTNYVQSQMVALDTSRLSVTASWLPDNNPGSTVQVTVAYTVVPLAFLSLKQNLQVSNTSQTIIVH
jgi:Flp pilus assembly protein TadG